VKNHQLPSYRDYPNEFDLCIGCVQVEQATQAFFKQMHADFDIEIVRDLPLDI
jgi:hypothetical protein